MNKAGGLYKKLRIKEIIDEAVEFKSIVFEESHHVAYKAGQYLTLVRFQDGEEVRRSYSITSSPELNEPLSIGVKRKENGFFSRLLVDYAHPGDEWLTTGSGGFFILPDDIENYQQLFFFAAGSGITPVYSLVKTALYAHTHLALVLIYSNASLRKAAFIEPLHQLQKKFSQRFHLELLFSNAVHLAKARLHRDLILKFLGELSITEKDKMLFYICGPESYMRLCTYTLQESGIPPQNIRKENFYIHVVPKTNAVPPDVNERTVHISFGTNQYEVKVRYPDSILRAAKKQGIALPYSCESGQCGNCVARCIRGKVWHSNNEVLTEKELQQGLVLTCVGHPVGGDVELEI